MKKLIITGLFSFACFVAGYSQSTEKATVNSSATTITTRSSVKNVNANKQMLADRSTITATTKPSSAAYNTAVLPRQKGVKVASAKIETGTK